MPDHQHMDMKMDAAAPAWTWTTDGSIFFGYNYQQRKFTDFSAWESQNWFMLAGQHPLGPGTFAFDAMLSLEPFTLDKIGSPQVFQTGETYHGGPIIDRQHPHDLDHGARRDVPDPARPRHVSLWRGRGRRAGARPDAVHAPRVGARQPRSAAHSSLHRLHAHHARRPDGRRRGPRRGRRGILVPRRGAERQPPQHRRAAIRLVVRPRQLGRRPMAHAVLRGAAPSARDARAHRHHAPHRVDRIRRRRSARVPSPRRSSGARTAKCTASSTAISSSGIFAPPGTAPSMDARNRPRRTCSISAGPIRPGSSSSIASRTCRR